MHRASQFGNNKMTLAPQGQQGPSLLGRNPAAMGQHHLPSSGMGMGAGGVAARGNQMGVANLGVTIRLHGLPLTASSADIRKFFSGLSIPDGGVHIIGGDNGEAFITFSSDEDGRLAMLNNNKELSGSKVSLFLSSKNEMQAKIDELRSGAALVQNPNFNSFNPTPAAQFFPQTNAKSAPPRAPNVQSEMPQAGLFNPNQLGQQVHDKQPQKMTGIGSQGFQNQQQLQMVGAPQMNPRSVFNPQNPRFATQNRFQGPNRFPNPRGVNSQTVIQNNPTNNGQQNNMQMPTGGVQGGPNNQMVGRGMRPGFDPRHRFPQVRNPSAPGVRPEGILKPPVGVPGPQNRPTRPGAFDIVRGSVPRQVNPQVRQPMSNQRPDVPGPNQNRQNEVHRPKGQIPIVQAGNQQGFQGQELMGQNPINQLPSTVASALSAIRMESQTSNENLSNSKTFDSGSNVDLNVGSLQYTKNILSQVSPDFTREHERKLGDRSSFERVDRQQRLSLSDNSKPDLKVSHSSTASQKSSMEDDRKAVKRSASRERIADNDTSKRQHRDESPVSVTSLSSRSEKTSTNFYYCMFEGVDIEVTDSDIKQFLSTVSCRTNMRPIILAKRTSCLVYLRFDERKSMEKCLQLHDRRFLSSRVKVYESDKNAFDSAYKDFQIEMNREIFMSLKNNTYRGEFVEISGLPDNVNNDDVMTHVLNGEKLQVDDIYIEYLPDGTFAAPYLGYVRVSCRKDADRLCQNSGRVISGRKIKLDRISENEFFQKIKDHQRKANSRARSSKSRSPSHSRSSRRRSANRSAESSQSRTQTKDSSSKQCPEDVCIEIIDLPKGKFGKRDIREFFKKLKVMHVIFDDDESKAYVEFDKEKEQIVALRMNNQKLKDHKMRILAIDSSEYVKLYSDFKAKLESKQPVIEKSESSARCPSSDSSSRSSKRSAYPKQFYKILFKKPLCTSLEVVRKFLQVTFESHIVLKKDPGGFTSEAYLMTCENPEAHFLALEGKYFCNVPVIVCKISEDDFKNGTNSIQPSPSVSSVANKPKTDENIDSTKAVGAEIELGDLAQGQLKEKRDIRQSIVKVSDLPVRVTTTDLEKLFSAIKIRKNGIALYSEKREAIVILEDIDEKEKALELNKTGLNGFNVKIEACSVSEAITRFPLAQFRPIAIADMEVISDEHVIAMVSGIPKGCEAKQLQELLKPCKIVSVTFMRAVSIAFVQMQNSLDAQFCSLKTGLKVADSEVTVAPKRKVDMEKMIADFKKKGSSALTNGTSPQTSQSASSANEASANATNSSGAQEGKIATPIKGAPPLPPLATLNKPEFSVHLTNLPTTVIKKDIIQLFHSLCLKESRIILKVNEQTKHAEAVVLLASLSECQAAQELNRTFLGPNKVDIKIVTGLELTELISSFGHINTPYQAPTPSKPNGAVANTVGFDPVTLRLSGLPIDVRPRDILEFFKDFEPNPEMLNINHDSITRACMAQLSFNNRSMGLRAMKEKQGTFLGGRKLIITTIS